MLDAGKGVMYHTDMEATHMNAPLASLTTIQYAALVMMRERGVGAINDGKGWIWPENVRTSEDAACRVVNCYQRRERHAQ